MMTTGGMVDLLELSRHLKQERLFVNAEKEQLQHLHSSVGNSAQRLFHLSWIVQQQKCLLNSLILGSKTATPEMCCQKINALETATFIDGYKQLLYHETKVGKFLKLFRECPKLVAACLVHAEASGNENMQNLARIVVSGVYGNVLMPEDEAFVMQVLKHLIDLQVSQSADPRRLLRKGNCAFSALYKLFNESLFSSRLFLTAALHKPVMQLLMEDEWFYDIDPEKALHRFPPKECLRRFGQAGTEEYEQKTQNYRDTITTKLMALAEQFISSLQANMYCFPPSLVWVISQLYFTLTKANTTEATEARIICTDLVLTYFICPAICDPEPYGITSDAPISYIARHNLMQIGQILQVLAISTTDEIDPKTKDLYGKFNKDCMYFVLDTFLDNSSLVVPTPQVSPNMNRFCRSSVILSCKELVELIGVVHGAVVELKEESPERQQLEQLLSTTSLPPLSLIQTLCKTTQPSLAHPSPNSTPQHSPPSTPVSSGRKTVKGKDKKRSMLLSVINADEPEESENQFSEDVLVISLGIVNDCPGMLNEQKVLEQEGRQKKVKCNSLLPGEDDPVNESDILAHEKRTRFSLSHDQDSIATSDNLEAISEAASSHSVGSDLDNENDNLSDMVSANVSGRGTPNVSGRDTPISQADSQMEGPEERRAVPDLPVTVQKTNREDVTDRFGKFDIKQELERDEAKSTVSDTWSTDVLASDSEPPEQNQLERLEEVAEESANVLGMQEVLEISETASDAWSTDVLASDTSERQSERLLELDQDDMASVSGRSVGVGSEVDDLTVEVTSDDTPQASGTQSPHEIHFVQVDTMESNSNLSSGSNLSQFDNFESTSVSVAGSQGLKIDKSNRPYSDGFVFRGKTAFHPASKRSSHDGILQSFDPLVYGENKKMDCFDKELDDSFSDDSYPDGGSGLSCENRSPILKASSDNGLNCLIEVANSNLDVSFHSSSSVGSLIDFTDHSPQESGAASTTMMGSSVSVDTLTNELSEGLKLTEQQNEKLDEKRLSVSSSCFDPLMQDNTDSRHSMSILSRGISTLDSVMGRAFASSEQGSKSKNVSGTPPKISVSNGVHTKGRGISLGVPNGKVQQSSLLRSGKGDEVDTGAGSGYIGNLVSFVSVIPGLTSKPTNRSVSATAASIGATAEASPTSSKEDEDKKIDKHDKRKPGFFHTFRERITRGSKRKVGKISDDVFRPSVIVDSERGSDGSIKVLIPLSAECADDSQAKYKVSKTDEPASLDTSDDILAKYRKSAVVQTHKSGDSFASLPLNVRAVKDAEDDEGTPAYDPNSLESCKAFIDAKKKLRLVLGNADFQVYHGKSTETVSISGCNSNNSAKSGAGEQRERENELVSFLKIHLAEAINLQDKDLIAQLHETIRCLRQFENHEIKKLLKTMRDEYRSRSPYVAYLVRSRQGLLSSLALLDRLLVRVKREKAVVNKYLLSVFVRLFLEKKDKALMKFISEFQKLSLSDEKTFLVETFLDHLHRQMEEDSLWQVANVNQLEEARLYIERNVMSHIYTHAMFPNGDGDIMRDQILQEHMKKLSKVITPSHKDLRIPKVYRYECPWPAAQTEIYMINAYKTPKDKLQCVLRCSTTIMNLLSMANEKSVPAADDFMPVLIFVMIKANVPSLLSTVQYIKSFYEKRLNGEEQYWWMQFSSAIEFIKTMDYNE